MRWLNWLLLLFALLNIILGVEAYAVKHSLWSLVGGVGSGALLLGFVALAKTNPRPGRIGSAVVTLLLLGRFVPVLVEKGQIYPAGVMTVASAIVLFALVGAHFYATLSKRRGG